MSKQTAFEAGFVGTAPFQPSDIGTATLSDAELDDVAGGRSSRHKSRWSKHDRGD